MNARISDYLAFGVPNIWLIDPIRRGFWIYGHNFSIKEGVGSVKLNGTDIEIPFPEIFD